MLRYGLLTAAGLLLAACSGGEPGTPENHPLLWIVGLSVSFLGIMAGIALGLGILRRHERREDRRDRRDERGPL